MPAISSEGFDKIAWDAFSTANNQGHGGAWYKNQVPYVSEPNALQNVDIWIPRTEDEQGQSNPSPAEVPKRPGYWLIYIHGGAWRDPLVTSSSFEPTVQCILRDQPHLKKHIAGLASINYTLSPHPNHPTLPAPVPGPGIHTDPSRSAKHPDHIKDVLSAISFLDSKFQFGTNYILAGHSCGATLALQVAMNRNLWSGTNSESTLAAPKPLAIIGLNGLYDLPNLIENPGEKHQKLAELYEIFTKNAFGDEKSVWSAVSPTSVTDWAGDWREGKQAILVQSQEDTLVPYSQTTLMLKSLGNSAGGALHISEMEASGDHNDLWHKGSRIAEILGQVLKSLV